MRETQSFHTSFITVKVAEVLNNLEMYGNEFTPQQIEKFKKSTDYYMTSVKAIEGQINSRWTIAWYICCIYLYVQDAKRQQDQIPTFKLLWLSVLEYMNSFIFLMTHFPARRKSRSNLITSTKLRKSQHQIKLTSSQRSNIMCNPSKSTQSSLYSICHARK